ncbi:MAG: hypothetical protein ACYT04_40240 [Nostoc sp.]
MKELKNKIDSIRRALKTKNINVPSAEVENKILELCPDFPDDWCSDIRTEIIKALIIANQSTELAPVETQEIISVDNAESEESISDSEVFQSITPLEEVEAESWEESDEELEEEEVLEGDYDQASELATVEDKSELVASTAVSMGIELQLSEIQNIASNMDYSGDSLGESIADIRAAITTFVEYKAEINQQKINHMITEVRATVNQRNKETSQRLNNGLSQIAKDIKEADTDFKSQVKSALQCFAIPANKAG